MSYLRCEEAAADLVMNLFIANRATKHSYHTLLQTIKVVNHTKEIAGFYQLDETDLFPLLMAAWFHDTGYLYDESLQPEQRSIMILDSFLQKQGTAADLVERACQYIGAIQSGPSVSSLAEKIICDAVTYDYGTLYFRETSFCLHADCITLLKNHAYYTEYCQLKLHRGKLENIGWLRAIQ